MIRIPLAVATIAGLLSATAGVARAPAMPTDRDRAELKGPVKTVSMRWEANHKDSYGQVEDRRLGSVTYDRAGAMLVDVQITPDFTRERKPERHGVNETVFRAVLGNATERYKFDAHGNMVERRTWYTDKPDGEAPMTERLSYDSAGRIIERELLGDRGQHFGSTRYERDAAGNVLVEEDRPEGQAPPFPRMHYTYTFDAHGNWTARLVKRENVPDDSYEYRYAGNLFREITYFDR